MMRSCIAATLLVLAGCAAAPVPPPAAPVSACAVHEASYDCQVERYHNVNVD
jgi:hypothetical protein